VIPFFNEEECAEKVVKKLYQVLKEAEIDFELVLVNNGSTDKTGEILNQLKESYSNIKIISVFPNQGYGWGIINGLAKAEGNFLGYLAGDGQIKPHDVVRVYQALNSQPIDFAKVIRVIRKDGLIRKIISRFYNLLFYLIFGIYDPDVNGTPKIFKKEILKKMKLKSKDWFIDAEFILKVKKLKLKGVQVPVEFLSRKKGKSHVKLSSIIEFLKNMIKYRLKPW